MRLIDADALKKMMFNYYECVNEHTNKRAYTGDTLMDYEVADLIEDCIDNAPTIDAVEVVRCKDCKHNVANMDRDPLDITDYTDVVCAYWMSDGLEERNDFCSRGERKEE